MNTVKEKNSTQELLCELYKNVKMGADSIINIMPKVSGKELRQEMTAELNRYEEFAKEIASELRKAGEEAKEENAFQSSHLRRSKRQAELASVFNDRI